jgi:hypothetical protein
MANQLTNPLGGRGTTGTVAKWSSPTTIGDSILTDSGTAISSSGPIRATGTSAAAPAFTGPDTDTGLYFPAANQVRISTAGSLAIAVDASQNVGIGTTSPTHKLQVVGELGLYNAGVDAVYGDVLFMGASPYQTTFRHKIKASISATAVSSLMTFSLTSGASTFIDVMTLRGDGNVGIGTASPAGKLAILHSATNPNGLASSTAIGALVLTNDAPTAGSAYIRSALLGTAAYDTGLQFGGYFYDGVSYKWTERMCIKGTGEVGIGTASPNEKLQVYGDLKVGVLASGSYISLGDEATTSRLIGIFRAPGDTLLGVGGYAGIKFTVQAASLGSQTERMRIDSAGNVGIGTASPTAGRSLTTAADCDIFGLRIGRGLLSEANSTALGASALNATVVGAINNTAVGSNAGKLLTTGIANTFAGYQSGFGTTTGGQNTYFGYSIATGSVSTGSRNTAIGGAAIAGISSGSDNVIVGYVAAGALTTGTNNIIIGASANTSGAAVTNEIVIGASVTGAGSNTTTIGTTATTRTVIPGGSLTVAGSVSRTSGSTAGVANGAFIVVTVPETYKALLLSSTTTSNETLSSLHLIGSDVSNCQVAAISVFQTTVANNGSPASVRITNTSGGTATVKWSFLQIS